MSKQHFLKILPEFFAAVVDGSKTFELRKNDRDFQVGDTVILQEFDHKTNTYTSDFVVKQISFMLTGVYGLEPGVSCLSLVNLSQEPL